MRYCLVIGGVPVMTELCDQSACCLKCGDTLWSNDDIRTWMDHAGHSVVFTEEESPERRYTIGTVGLDGLVQDIDREYFATYAELSAAMAKMPVGPRLAYMSLTIMVADSTTEEGEHDDRDGGDPRDE